MSDRDGDMGGKTCLVTGATGGIGKETALALGRLGATVLVVGRNGERAEAVAKAIREDGGSAHVFLADLSCQGDIRRLADAVLARFPALDVLINNAGAMFGRRQESADGIEMTFALNHLAYVLLTHLLLPSLTAAASARPVPSRIVNVASNAHKGVRLNFDDLEARSGYRGFVAYKKSKLCNLYFTYELARRLEARGAGRAVTVNALHPGFVRTEIGVSNRWTQSFVWRLLTLAAIPVADGARTSIHLASSPAVAGISGQYFVRCQPARSSAASHDREAAARLWDVSHRMLGLKDSLPG